MKKFFILALSVTVLFSTDKFSHAEEDPLNTFSIGFTSFINSYEPAWGSEYDEIKSGAGIENGIFIACGFYGLQMSLLFMNSDFGSTGDLSFEKDDAVYGKSVNTSMERTDIDFVLQYGITPSFKLFAGGKLFYLLLESPVVDINGTKETITSSDEDPCEYGGYGLGAGIAYSKVLFAWNSFIFQIQPSLSYVMLWGDATQSFVYVTDYNPDKTIEDYSKAEYTAKGLNGVINIVMTIVLSEGSEGDGKYFSLSGGYRYQYMRYSCSDPDFKLADEKHHGLMLAGMFTLRYNSITGCCIF